jgi:hypothetical protein
MRLHGSPAPLRFGAKVIAGLWDCNNKQRDFGRNTIGPELYSHFTKLDWQPGRARMGARRFGSPGSTFMKMKKFVNNPENLVRELLEGYTLAYPDKVKLSAVRNSKGGTYAEESGR